MFQVLVYCQPTIWSDRLTSLMSAVLLNPIRPDFTRAIMEKPSLHENHRSQKPCVGIILVGGTRRRSFKRRISQFAVRFNLKIFSLPASIYADEARFDDDMLLVTLEEVAKFSNKYVMVLLDDGLGHKDAHKIKLDAILTSRSLLRMQLLGCIAMESAVSDLSVFDNYYPTLPVLVVASSNKESRHAFGNPSMIWTVISDNALHHWTQDQTINVWLARTIAKYTEAVTLLVKNKRESTSSRPTLLPSRL